jgi:HD-like signal output (HDOD) protein
VRAVKDVLEELKRGYSLPTLSPVAMKIVELASDETCSVDSMAGLIETDPSLAVRLLHMANSAFFATRCPVTTMHQAILRVGVERLRIMALSLSLRDTFPMGRVGPMDYESFWRCSLYRALLSRSLAKHLGTRNPEEAFLAGLTLEIGLLIFVDWFIKGKEEAVFDQHAIGPLLLWERERTGTDHRTIGEVALRYWRFPDSIVACQRSRDGHPAGGRGPSMAGICQTAGTLASMICRDDVEVSDVFAQTERRFGVSRDVACEMLADAFDQVQEIGKSLQVEVDREKDIVDLLERANRTLSRLFQGVSADAPPHTRGELPSFAVLRDKQAEKAVVSQTLEAVSHEIRNPLMVVGGLARRLSRSVDPSSRGGRVVQSILEEVGRLEHAMTQMTRMAAGE